MDLLATTKLVSPNHQSIDIGQFHWPRYSVARALSSGGGTAIPGLVQQMGLHVSGDNLGSNFFTIDLLKSSSVDPSNKGPSGAQEWYGFYKRSFSLSALTGNKGGYGIAKDLSLIARFDAGTKNTTFAPAPRKVRLGMSAAMPVTAGFWDVGLEVMKESNHNGVVGKDVSFSSAPVFTTA